MEPDVQTEQDFQEFFGMPKYRVLMENPSEAPRLGMIGDAFFTTMQSVSKYAGDYDPSIRMMWGLFGHQRHIRVLDYGNAGQFTGLKLYFLGFPEVVIADEESIFMDFMKFLTAKYDVQVIYQNFEETQRSAGGFELVLCQQVPSAFGDPLVVLRNLRYLMSPAGFLYVSQLINCHPFLSELRYLLTMKKQGFVPVWDDKDGLYHGFQRTR